MTGGIAFVDFTGNGEGESRRLGGRGSIETQRGRWKRKTARGGAKSIGCIIFISSRRKAGVERSWVGEGGAASIRNENGRRKKKTTQDCAKSTGDFVFVEFADEGEGGVEPVAERSPWRKKKTRAATRTRQVIAFFSSSRRRA